MNRLIKNKDKDRLLKNKDINTEDSMSKDVTIYILVTLLSVLIIYLVATKFINTRNLEISEFYTVFSTEITEQTTETQSLLVDINTDNVFELTLLPGIGSNKATAIIEYRKENGDFESIEELMNVSGIGESVFNKLKSYIYVSAKTGQNTTDNNIE